jgi:hypothetical protein
MTMRYLLLCLLLAAPLPAQEEKEKEEPAKKDRAAEIRKLLDEFVAAYETDAEAARKKVEALLRQLLDKDLDVFLPRRAAHIILQGTTGGHEVIRGSSDGTSYTLHSLGGGKYRLEATQKDEKGETRKITDTGTLKELRSKYGFLKGSFVIGVPLSVDAFKPVPVEAFEVGALVAPGRQAARTPTKIGVMVQPPGEELSHHLELPAGGGLVVGPVFPGSRGAELGLRQYDVLLRIDGELIDSPEQLDRLQQDRGTLEYIRRAKKRTLDLSQVAKPARAGK